MREVISEVNAPVPEKAPSVVVAMTVVRLESVPYAKPCCVASAPPVLSMEPLRVAEVEVMEEAAEVVRVERVIATVVVDKIEPYPVPAEFVAYALK